MPNNQDPEHWERSTNIAHALIEDSGQTVYLGVTEFYVGLHESSGGKGLRTTRYEFYVKDQEGGVEMRVPITPWQMIEIGRQFVNNGIDELGKRLVALVEEHKERTEDTDIANMMESNGGPPVRRAQGETK